MKQIIIESAKNVFQAANLPNNLSSDAKQAFEFFMPAWSIVNNLGMALVCRTYFIYICS